MKGKKIKYFVKALKKIRKNVWTFPLVVLSGFVILSLFGISGSSVGVYDSIVFPSKEAQQDTIFNYPRPVRSDEWNVNTQFTLSQVANNYPLINKTIGYGQDMSLVLDVPYKEWSVFFKPQNLIFFIAPQEFAFAFKWWLIGFLLIISCYFLFLKIMPGNKKLSAILSMTIFFTPIIQWWYQTITLAPIYTSFFILLCLFTINEKKQLRTKVLVSVLLAYLLASFALIMYPPFQIAMIICVTVIYIGYLIQKYKQNIKTMLLAQIPILIALSVSLIIISVFYITRSENIQTNLNTSYPGQRVISSGGYPFINIITGYLQPLIQSQKHFEFYSLFTPTNQSEMSGFTIPIIGIILLSIIVSFKMFKIRVLDWRLVVVSAVVMLLLIRILVPTFDRIYSLMGLSKVPHARLLLGIGILVFVQLALIINNIKKYKINFSINEIFIILFITTYISIVGLAYIYAKIPGYIPGILQGVLLCLFPVVFIYSLMIRKFYLGVILLFIMSIISTIKVNPLEIYVNEINDTNLSHFLVKKAKKEPSSRWVVAGQGPFLNYAQANGAKSISGVYTYPQLEIWSKFPQQDKHIYNRYAHVSFNFSDDIKKPYLRLIQADSFEVNVSICDKFIKNNHIKYVLSTKKITSKCLNKQVESIPFNNGYVFVSKVIN